MSSEHITPDTTEYAIEVNGLGKCYQIYDKPSDRLKQMLMRGRKQYYKEFWALNDVSFKIKKGETLGIIGRNGAGKSTLLQMLCGTLNPSTGEIKTNGRLAALLELGAGFNPEFTGRENVFLSAALHGLSDTEIQDRFDSIAAFADIGDFIDQAVRSYSTGMFVRLAFAVQVHLEPDVFVIDEALAVGDQRFVQKCYRKLEELKSRGTSLLFVSHDTTAIKMLSDSAIWIHDGKLRKIGDSSSVVDAYRNWSDGISESVAASSMTEGVDRTQKNIVISKACLFDGGGKENNSFIHGEPMQLSIELQNQMLPVGTPVRAGFSVRNTRGVEIFGSNTTDARIAIELPAPGDRLILDVNFRLPLLAGGIYTMSMNVDACREDDKYETEALLVDFLSFHIDEIVKVYTLIGIDAKYEVKNFSDYAS
jgi:lipopolysaccharide transport system ATP-binding protein